MNNNILDREALDRLISTRDAAQAWICILEILDQYGFDHLLYGTNRLRGAGVFGKRSDSFFLSNLPQDLMKKFWDEELYRTTPISIWAMLNEGAKSFIYGSELYHAGELTQEQTDSQLVLMEAGVTSGYVIGFNPPNTKTATALALINIGKPQQEADQIWAEHGDIIKTYAAVFNLRMSSLPIPIRDSGLTKRQHEVLHWAAHGKTTAEVATILGLSSATIEKHLRQARDTLGVATTTQAVLYAQINNHIFTSDP